MRRAMHALGLRYQVDAILPGTRRRPDVVFKRLKVAVFVDGCFWHGCPKHGTWPKANAVWWRSKINANKARDADTDASLRESDWRVLRFWAHEDATIAAALVLQLVRSLSGRVSRSKIDILNDGGKRR